MKENECLECFGEIGATVYSCDDNIFCSEECLKSYIGIFDRVEFIVCSNCGKEHTIVNDYIHDKERNEFCSWECCYEYHGVKIV